MICPHCQKDTESVFPSVGFSEWWKNYPLKKAKKDAEKAWDKESDKTAMIEGLARQLPGMLKNPKFIPYAGTWIRGRRWEDEPANSGSIREQSRVIVCCYCGDAGIASGITDTGERVYMRCSCPRGGLPGLVIPQADPNEPAPF